MSEVPYNVRKVLVIMVPAAVIHDIACFVFYDNHPRDNKNIDVTIFTKSGEVREYYQRSLLSSTRVDGVSSPSKLRILRNNECELFYLLSTDDELIILSRRENLRIHQRVSNIERFEVNDSMCSGTGCLKIVKKDDAVPLIFDDDFDNFHTPDMSETYTAYQDDCLPLVTHLQRKLIEAKYSVKCTDKTYKELLDLRQKAAFSMYKELHPNLDDSVIKGGLQKMVRALKLKFKTPFVKVCNKMIIIAYIAINENVEPLQDIQILLHGTTGPSLVYTTKLFEKINTPPFWKANSTRTISYNIETAIVAVMDMKEMKYYMSNVEFNGVITYSKAGKDCLLPIENVQVSAMDMMGKEFDVLSNDNIDSNTMLSILAVTEKTDLILRHVRNNEDPCILGMDMFCKYLDMAPIPESDIVIHRSSPYHVLNGVMIIKRNEQGCLENCLNVTVHSRSSYQVLALIHYIHDAIPLTIIATTTNYTITAKDNQISSRTNEDTQRNTSHNYQDYGLSILDRNKTILEYLDSCMIKMNESKNPAVQCKIGAEIDLLAEGKEKYLEFRSKMLDKAAEGMKMVLEVSSDIGNDTMVID